MKVRVVKIGGRPLGDAAWLAEFAAMAARSATPLVVVHGGGPEVDSISVRLGVPVERRGGLRITTPEGLEVATMVLGGLLNKRLVDALRMAGVDALGLSGVDGALVTAQVVAGGALGRVGEVVNVRAELIHGLLGLGLLPVISPISRDAAGGALNVNADDAAVAIAAALGATELLFLTDVPAVRGPVGELSSLSAGEAEHLLEAGVIRDGMAVKVRAALRGVAAGLGGVRIGGVEILADSGRGTRITLSEVLAEVFA